LLEYVKKKKEDDPHDGVLSRIFSRLNDVVEKIEGTAPASQQPTTPTTPTVTVPGLPQWKFVRKRGGRIVKVPVKQEVPKT
jgi:hypothetical protein